MDKNQNKNYQEVINSLENQLNELKKELADTKQNEREFRKIVDDANAYIIKIFEDYTIDYVNKQAIALFKNDLEFITGNKYS